MKKMNVLLAAAVLLAGCTSNPDDENGSTETERIGYHLAVEEGNGHRWVFEAVQDTNATISVSSQKEAEKSHLDECGQILSYVNNQGEQESVASISWFESRGRALAITTDGTGETMVPYDGAQESFALTVNRDKTNEVRIQEGETLVVDMYRGTDEGNVYRSVASVNGSLKLIHEQPLEFQCGANLDGFDGNHAMTGAGVGVQVSIDAMLTQTVLDVERSISFFTFPDPRFPGTCEVSISVDGEVVDADSSTNDFCAASYSGFIASTFSLEVIDSVMVAPVFGYFVKEPYRS